jgi:23S rRNA pseudouridine1911/1915/1917 synthase
MMEDDELDIEEQDELYEHYKFIADKGQTLIRIDKFLVDRIPNTSRNKIQIAARSGNILVNNNTIKPNYKIKPEDEVSIVLPYPVREIELIPENIPIDVIYEDDSLIVINKSPDIVVHPGYGNYTGTLVNALIYHFDNLPQKRNDYAGRPGLVHRLDKKTSGLMVIAKTEHAMSHLAKQFFDRTIDRKYNALVWGEVEQEEGTVIGHIGRSLKNRKVMTVFEDGSYGKHAVTHYKVLEKLGYVTLVECKLETGRTHQIRVQMKYIGHPLFNDEEYEGNKILKGTSFTKYKQFISNCFNILPRQALHAKSLGFEHPETGERMYFESNLPDDMTTVLDKWRTYIEGRNDK